MAVPVPPVMRNGRSTEPWPGLSRRVVRPYHDGVTVPRLTAVLVDVLDVLVRAHDEHSELSGWQIIHAARRSGASVYRAIDRLEDAGWITARWEHPEDDPPRRRVYTLTGEAVGSARAALPDRLTRAPLRPALGTP